MNIDREPVLAEVAELLNGYTPIPSASPEWREIQKRSRSRSRRMLLVAAVALVVAAPALALSTSVRNLVASPIQNRLSTRRLCFCRHPQATASGHMHGGPFLDRRTVRLQDDGSPPHNTFSH